jgi:hypothetical protein
MKVARFAILYLLLLLFTFLGLWFVWTLAKVGGEDYFTGHFIISFGARLCRYNF